MAEEPREGHERGRENMERLLNLAIMPESLLEAKEIWNPKDYPGDSPLVPTRRFEVRSEVFVFLRELARAFVDGTIWDKKARIVLEYDPRSPKMVVQAFMERDEVMTPEERQSHLDEYLQP